MSERRIAVTRALLRGWRRPALRTGALAGVDQLVFSGSNFVAAAVIARSAGAYQYGIYAMAWSIVLLVTAVGRALITSPYTYQSQRWTGAKRALRRGSALLQVGGVSVLLAGISTIACIGLTLTAGVDPQMAVAVGSAMIGWGLRDFCRRVLFADHRFDEAVLLDGVVGVIQIACLVALASVDRLSAVTGMAAIAFSSGAAASACLAVQRTRFLIRMNRALRDLRSSWQFGRWLALSEFAFAGQDVAIQAIVAAGGGFSATGVFAACMTLVRLGNPLVQAIGNAVGPLFAKSLAGGGVKQLRDGVRRVGWVIGAAMVLFVAGAVVAGELALELIYGADYADNGLLLVLLVGGFAATGIAVAPSKALSAVDLPRQNLWANLASIVTTIVLALATLPFFGLLGVASAAMSGSVLAAILKWRWYRQAVVQHVASEEVR